MTRNPEFRPGSGFQPSLLAMILLVALAAVISGCAGTAKGRDTSVYSNLETGKVSERPTSEASAMVIIRYPALIHTNAENLYVSSFTINAIGGEVPYGVHGNRQTSRVAQSIIEKSSYYAMSLYNELKKTLPENSVLLSPHIVDWNKERGLYSRPILGSEQVPSVLTIDFNIYSFPDVNDLMDSPPVTFGDLVTPMILVKSSRWIQPSLGGLLISSPPLVSSAWRQVHSEARQSFKSRLDGLPQATQSSLGFVAFLRERDEPNLPLPLKTGTEANRQVVAVEQYALEKIRMNGEVVANLPEDYSTDPFVLSFVRGASTRIVEILNSVDHEEATFFAMQAALERFDPELARVFFVRSSDESVRARLALAQALVGAEREFLAAQSDSIHDGTFSGSYGAKMRKIIAAEYRMLEERRQLARKQNLTTAVAVVALAGSVYGAVASAAGGAAAVATSAALLGGSGWALHKTLETKTESREVNRYFLARMAPAFDRQMSVQMEWLESKEVITARGFAEFRNKTLSLYQSRVRSMQVSADERCLFMHPEFGREGRWFGVCESGLASGRGYGIIMNARGDTVEFIGEADKGFAAGSGGMIIQPNGQLGATYFEGSFKQSLPDGVVRVENAGQQPRLRQYQAGVDVGRGNANRLQNLDFAFNSGLEDPVMP
ncbi:MAG: hypothetical protein HKP21_00405 [Xanthomonadales bacterium]|nr:hypothetical protein [Gammaproteobacteria bacterium]NNK02987.1 hypothetical protein [Xanthomonadales bacterium]